jgi:hypothetical protein
MYLKIKVLALSIHDLGVAHCTEENNTPKPRVVIGHCDLWASQGEATSARQRKGSREDTGVSLSPLTTLNSSWA